MEHVQRSYVHSSTRVKFGHLKQAQTLQKSMVRGMPPIEQFLVFPYLDIKREIKNINRTCEANYWRQEKAIYFRSCFNNLFFLPFLKQGSLILILNQDVQIK